MGKFGLICIERPVLIRVSSVPQGAALRRTFGFDLIMFFICSDGTERKMVAEVSNSLDRDAEKYAESTGDRMGVFRWNGSK